MRRLEMFGCHLDEAHMCIEHDSNLYGLSIIAGPRCTTVIFCDDRAVRRDSILILVPPSASCCYCCNMNELIAVQARFPEGHQFWQVVEKSVSFLRYDGVNDFVY